jgi:hypothetical protein
VYMNTCARLRSKSFGPALPPCAQRALGGRRSLGVVEAATLRSLSFGRQAEFRKIRLDHLKMKLGITRPPGQ